MILQPWYKVVTPREDLRRGEPLDAAQFAIHLDQVLDGKAPLDYRDPSRLFSRTYLTAGLLELISEVMRRLSGEKVGSSSVISLTTQFGGGKTHALTLLYHLVGNGHVAKRFEGVDEILKKAKIREIPRAVVAVFVGSAFDFLDGKGEKDEPRRKTPWGEIAWQLGGIKGFRIIEEHDIKKTAPGKDVIRKIVPEDKPALILMDEVLNFMSRARTEKVGDSTLASQFYEFLHNLSEEVSSRTGVCVVLSLPKSEREMSVEDEVDFARLQKLATRVGKAYVLSEGLEIAEIIRRRLFEDLGDQNERKAISKSFAEWIVSHRDKLPTWFPVDNARQIFEATYPFHPAALSVFERKWQSLPQFQRTRGVLRMFALWVSKAYAAGFSGAHKDAVIALGSAPFEDAFFRAEIFDQLGQNLEAAIISDVAGEEAHATRLDSEASNSIKNMRLHQKVAATVFFESSGGQVKEFATGPEIRLGVSDPDLDIANVETVLENLLNECYHLTGEGKRYWVSPAPNLNKLLADRRATIDERRIEEKVEEEIRKVFSAGSGAELVFFPEESGQIPDIATITLVVLHPKHSWTQNSTTETQRLIENMTKEHGASARTCKSALIWAIADSLTMLSDEARKVLAWEAIQDESDSLRLTESQRKYLKEQLGRSERDLKEAVWRTYKNIFILGKDGGWKKVDLGLVHSSAAQSLLKLILTRLTQEGDLEEEAVSASFLVRNWPPALPDWNTKAVRDVFFAAPQFPRLSKPESVRRTIAEGVTRGLFGYAEKAPDGSYLGLRFGEKVSESDVEISEDVYLIPKEVAQAIKSGSVPLPSQVPTSRVPPAAGRIEAPTTAEAINLPTVGKLTWEGIVPPQKWMTFYTKVLSRFPLAEGLKLTVRIEVQPKEGLTKQKVNETKAALRELALPEELQTEEKPQENEQD
nr:DUF499 domain-containing protein [Candidatus Njordarchaeota archaeon]